MDKDKLILAAVVKEVGERFEGGWRVFVKRETTESIEEKDGIHFLGDDIDKGEWIVYLPKDGVMRIAAHSLHASHMIGEKVAGHRETKRDVKDGPPQIQGGGIEDCLL